MKRIIFGTLGGLALLALAPVSAFAHADVHVDLGFGVFGPAPYYVEPPPVYYEPPVRYYSPPVYYGPTYQYEDRRWDRESDHHDDWDHHDRGRHRGHRHHHHDDNY